MNLLECNQLTKKYGSIKALDNISFEIEKGKVVGLLGINGSGKSSLLKIISQMIIPNSGEVLFKEKKLDVNSKNDIAYLPDVDFLEDNLSVKGMIKFFSEFYKGFDIKKAYNYLDLFDLDKDTMIYKMTKGMKEILQLILVMSRKADLYILDEPLSSVESITRESILNTIIKKKDKNSSIIITTQIVSEVEDLLDEVIILDKGKIVFKDELKNVNTSLKNILKRYLRVKEIM